MKTRSISFLLVLCVASLTASAQDVIIKRDGEEIKAKVEQVLETMVKYRKFDNLSGPVYEIAKKELFMIRYENGSKDLFNENPADKSKTKAEPAPSSESKPNVTNTSLTHRSPGNAFLFSFLYPGAGQLYARKQTKGIIMMGTFSAALVLFFAAGDYDEYSYSSYYNGSYYETTYVYEGTYWTDAKTAGFVAMAAIKLWSMIDAPFSANSTNREFGLSKVKVAPDSYWVRGGDGQLYPVIGATIKIKL